MWIDTHAHLANICESEFLQGLDAAKRAGVSGIINIGTNIEESRIVIKQAKINAPIKTFAVVGIAVPDSADYCENNDWVAEIESLAKEESVVAIGETGLDFAGKEDYPSVEKQTIVFEKHMEIAKKINKPIIIHSRMADEKVLEMLQSAEIKKAVFHCFTGTPESAKKITDAGFYISFSGIATFKKGSLDASIKVVPEEQILIETDAPWLAPVPFRGKKNEPAFVHFVGEKIAEIRGIENEKFAEQILNNAEKFFGVKF
jgi:TatD DNase family protein